MRTRISRSTLDAIRQSAAEEAPREACGLLFGEATEVTDWCAAANVAQVPERRFEIDPVMLFAALRAERAGERALTGYWHSHPGGAARPSRTDAEMAAPDGKLWLIVGQADVALWRAVTDGPVHGRFEPIALDVIADQAALATSTRLGQ